MAMSNISLVPIIILFLTVGAQPAIAQESILLNVNQTHTLQWDWAQGEDGPIRSFVFQCQQYRKELEADARSLRFGSLIDEPGRYTGCTLAAKNEAGLSSPVIVPDFEYAYSYQRLGIPLLEMLAMAGATVTIVKLSGVSFLGWLKRRRERASPLALPEPCIILEKDRVHAARYY